jgi:hypothetical protein
VPRAVRIRGGTVAGRVLLWFLLIGCLVVGPIWGNSVMNRFQTLEKSGVVIQANLISAEVSHGKGSSFFFTVSFALDGQSVQSRRQVSHDLYYTYADRRKVPVTTMPGDPNDFEIGYVTDDGVASARAEWTWGVLAAITIACVAVVTLESNLSFERRLLSTGEAVIGHVTDVIVQRGRSVSTSVRYSYESAIGYRTGSRLVQTDVSGTYPKGEPIIVLYRRDNDRQSRPLKLLTMVELQE